MIIQRGSQSRELLADTDYEVVGKEVGAKSRTVSVILHGRESGMSANIVICFVPEPK